jgi:hypothetical protein
MGNRHCKCCSNKVRNEPQLEVATEAAVKRPWLEPLSRNGIPLLIFGNLQVNKICKVKKNGIQTQERIYLLKCHGLFIF